MKLFKTNNKFEQKEQEEALENIISKADTHFLGDEMLVVNKNMHFFNDEKFTKVLDELAVAQIYKGMAWRLHTLVWASEMALKIDGCFIECGVFRGFKSDFLLKYFEEKIEKRPYYLFDTFEGIDTAQSHLSPISNSEHNKTNLHRFIKYRFKEFSNVVITKGSVPDSLKEVNIDKIAFLHLDMNSYQAEIAALEFLWDKIVKGAVIVLDDFGLYSHKSQMEKELPWFEERGYKILELTTGQGIVIK